MTTLPALKQVIEAAIFAAGEPLSLERLKTMLFDDGNPPPPDNEWEDALRDLAVDYEGRVLQLQKVSSGYRFQVREAMAPSISRLWEERPARYTRALLETLALVAYRQPITRGEIEDIRGVSVSTQIFKTLQDREWVRVVGHRDVPGRPALYATTRQFLDYFNLSSLDELPPLSALKDLDQVAEGLDFEDIAAAVRDEMQTPAIASDVPQIAPVELVHEVEMVAEESLPAANEERLDLNDTSVESSVVEAYLANLVDEMRAEDVATQAVEVAAQTETVAADAPQTPTEEKPEGDEERVSGTTETEV